MSWLSRAGARLLPAERRDWAEAVWAEAQEVTPGWPRLAWRAGGVRLIAREAQMVRRIGILLLFTAAAGTAAWSAWPGSSVGHATTVRADVIVTVALLAGLPLLTRWLLGPPGNRVARWLRTACYAAILALMRPRLPPSCSWARCRGGVSTCIPMTSSIALMPSLAPGVIGRRAPRPAVPACRRR